MRQSPHGAILVGVDGSAAALGAVRWAAHDAALRNVRLTLVHAFDTPLPEWLEFAGPAGPRHSQKQRAHHLIEAAINVVEESAGGSLQIESKLCHSAAVPALVDLSKDAEMVVVGWRGHGRTVAHGFLGSVSSALVHHAHCPVAVIRDDHAIAANVAPAPVLVGIDGSPASEAATAIAFEQASRRGVGLTALHAWMDPRSARSRELIQDANWDAELSQEEETLAERLAGWHERYPEVGIRRRIEIGDPARWLIAASERAQLVVVGSHGCGWFSGRLLGSVGAAVVNRAKSSVIVARHGPTHGRPRT
ncbi:universal stress protein [Mycobacterium sp. 050272]|uniref:universal stress protein n=1 Tax=Mycobacterium sp. 050272 TaxID=3142488 RepID=UPI00318B3588